MDSSPDPSPAQAKHAPRDEPSFSRWAGLLRAQLSERFWMITTVVTLVLLTLLLMFALSPHLRGHVASPSATGEGRELAAEALYVRDLGPGEDGKRWYDVSLQTSLRNTSDSYYIVPWSLDELFLGETKPPAAGTVGFVNPPPRPIADVPAGVIGWKLIQSQASYLWNEESLDLGDEDIDESDIIAYLKQAHLSTANANSGLIGRLMPGNIRSHAAHYQFQAAPDAYVAVMLSYGTEEKPPVFGTNPDYLWDTQRNRYEMVRLSDASGSPCRFGVRVEAGRIEDACAGTSGGRDAGKTIPAPAR